MQDSPTLDFGPGTAIIVGHEGRIRIVMDRRRLVSADVVHCYAVEPGNQAYGLAQLFLLHQTCGGKRADRPSLRARMRHALQVLRWST